jgi:hypothetical protein
MPSLSDLKYFFSSRQRPQTHHLYELRVEPERCLGEQRDRRRRRDFDSFDMVYSERIRQRVRYFINLKRAPDQFFSISSVMDLQLEGRLKR